MVAARRRSSPSCSLAAVKIDPPPQRLANRSTSSSSSRLSRRRSKRSHPLVSRQRKSSASLPPPRHQSCFRLDYRCCLCAASTPAPLIQQLDSAHLSGSLLGSAAVDSAARPYVGSSARPVSSARPRSSSFTDSFVLRADSSLYGQHPRDPAMHQQLSASGTHSSLASYSNASGLYTTV